MVGAVILVTGATGEIGVALVGQLSLLDIPFHALVRDVDQGRELLGREVALVQGDLEAPDTLPAALEGIERVFLLCASRPDQVELETGMIEAAARAGVRHTVKMSFFGASPSSPAPYLRWHGEIERVLEASGMAYTHLRPPLVMQTTVGMLAPDGGLYVPAGEGRIGWIDMRDVAAAAVRPLTDDGHEDTAYDLTGPESLGFGEVAERIAAATERDVRYVDVPPDAAAEAMTGMGMPDWQVQASMALLALVREGGLDAVSDAYERLVGVQPHSFAEFARDYTGDLAPVED